MSIVGIDVEDWWDLAVVIIMSTLFLSFITFVVVVTYGSILDINAKANSVAECNIEIKE